MTATAIWTPTREDAAHARAEAGGETAEQPGGVPFGPARTPNFPVARDDQGKLELRGERVEWGGKPRYQLDGYATVWRKPYEMWDVFGPYREHVNEQAADATLARDDLDTSFLLNHRGMTMARTVSTTGQPSLALDADKRGMHARAFVNPERQDVKDMILAIEDGDITEMSFAFLIREGTWNDDFTEYEILEFDLHRGDVSAVNYGANPYTSLGVRAQEFMHDLNRLPAGMARAAAAMLLRRDDLAVEPIIAPNLTRPDPERPQGRSIAMLEAELRLEDDE